MADRFLTLSDDDRRDVIGIAADRSDVEETLVEKDVWVVFALEALFRSDLRNRLVFKGGTSLSKVYGVIDRFSEDVDVTYDIREIADELVAKAGSVIPPNASQKRKWTDVIEDRLPGRLETEVMPVLRAALGDDVPGRLRREGTDVFIEYEPLFTGTGYVEPRVLLEFGAKSTGEPCENRTVICDAAAHHPEIIFPQAEVRAMCAEGTWWEKATAAHVYCLQGNFRGGHRFARHWFDLVKLDDSGHAATAIDDRGLASLVAERKRAFFAEKHAGSTISYDDAVGGGLRLVPEGQALAALRADYALMVEAGMFMTAPPTFDALIARCGDLEQRANDAARMVRTAVE